MVPESNRRAGPFEGNGVATSFAFNFKTLDKVDLRVVRAIAIVESDLVLDSDYSVTLNADQETSPGGTITYPIVGSPLALGEYLTIISNLAIEQQTDIPDLGAFNASIIESALDRAVMLIGQQQEQIDRALLLPVSADSASLGLPDPEPLRFIGWNTDGTALANLEGTGVGDAMNITYIQTGAGAVATTVQAKLREAATPVDYGADKTGVADTAADFAQALAANGHVTVPAGVYKNTAGFSTVNGKTLQLLPGASFSGAGSVTRVAGDTVMSWSEGAQKDCWYLGKKLTGARATGAGPLMGYSPISYLFDVLTDDSDVGVNGFGTGLQSRMLFGGAATTGGRLGFHSSLFLTAPTNAANANRNYVAGQLSAFASTGDGGTNTGAGAKGAVFGGGSAMYAEAAATNMYGLYAHEFNTFTKAGATTKYLAGLAITGCNATRGAALDAAITIGAQAAAAGYGPHAGWGYGICLTDVNGANPFTATSTIIGSVSGAAMPVLDGINFSGFTFAGQILKGAYLAINESAISLGDTAGNAAITVAGASANANLILTPKGTGVISTGTNGWAVSGVKVVGARDTGWAAMTNTANKATVYDTTTITLAQLASRVKSLQDALTTHGLIGT